MLGLWLFLVTHELFLVIMRGGVSRKRSSNRKQRRGGWGFGLKCCAQGYHPGSSVQTLNVVCSQLWFSDGDLTHVWNTHHVILQGNTIHYTSRNPPTLSQLTILEQSLNNQQMIMLLCILCQIRVFMRDLMTYHFWLTTYSCLSYVCMSSHLYGTENSNSYFSPPVELVQ